MELDTRVYSKNDEWTHKKEHDGLKQLQERAGIQSEDPLTVMQSKRKAKVLIKIGWITMYAVCCIIYCYLFLFFFFVASGNILDCSRKISYANDLNINEAFRCILR